MTHSRARASVGSARVICLLLLAGSLQADTYSDLFRAAEMDAKQGKYLEAVAKYKAALKIRPGAPEAVNNLAVMYYEAGNYKAAYETASGIWRAHPQLKAAALITGLAAVQLNQSRDAIAPLERVLGTDRRNRDARLGLASAYVALDELEKAVQIYEEQTSQAPGDVTAWYGLGICYERMAESASKKLARLPGNATYSKRLLAEYLQNAGDERLAREAFGDAEDTKNIDSPEARATFEQARMLAGKAKHAFEQVVSLAPGSWQTAVFLGDVDRQHGRLLSALEHYRQAASIDPNNTAALLGIGTVYWELGDFERAADSLQEVCKRNPQAAQATFELGNIAVRQHREAQAIPLLERYLAQQPDALAARADLGRAYFHLKEYAKALPELKKAAATDEQGDIHYQLSICLRQQGRIEEAEAALQASRAIREAQNDRLRRLQANQ